MGTLTAFAFLVGGITSMVSGYIGMMIAVFTNARCTMCATMVPEQTAWRESFNSAFRGGAVMGFALAGLGLLVMYFLMCLYVSAFEVCYTDRPSAPAYHQHVRYFPSLARRFARGL